MPLNPAYNKGVATPGHYYSGFDVVMLVLGNESGGPHHVQGCHTQGLWIGLRKLVVWTLNIHQIFN